VKRKPKTGKLAKTSSDKSKSTRMRERERRCDELYWIHCYKPPAIRDILADEGLFEAGGSRHAALRWVQSRVMQQRSEASPAKVKKLQRTAETERYERQLEDAIRSKREIERDDSMIQREVVTPKGDVITVSEPRWPAAQREKASTARAAIAEKLALVRGVDTKGAAIGAAEGDPADPGAEKKPAEPFAFTFPNVKGTPKDLDTMIAMNLDRDMAKVN
jgi:hypothetical protein